MHLLVGLGNPGAKHAQQRHNIGFMAVDAIAEEHGFSPWRSKFKAQIAEGRIGRGSMSGKVLLLKPETFMNLSGQSVGEALRYLKIDPDKVWVFHDELDLAPGKLRTKSGGGHAGHNGLRSLHQHIGADYHRVRLGIGHPGHKDRVAAYVLHEFAKADQDWLAPLIAATARAAGHLINEDANGFMNAVALNMQPFRGASKSKQLPSRGGDQKTSRKIDTKNDLLRIRKPFDKKIDSAPDAAGEGEIGPVEGMLGKLLAKFSRN